MLVGDGVDAFECSVMHGCERDGGVLIEFNWIVGGGCGWWDKVGSW